MSRANKTRQNTHYKSIRRDKNSIAQKIWNRYRSHKQPFLGRLIAHRQECAICSHPQTKQTRAQWARIVSFVAGSRKHYSDHHQIYRRE